MDRVRLADAELGHGADPAGDAMLVAEVVDGLRRAEPADALDLEVDDPPGTPLDRGPAVRSRLSAVSSRQTGVVTACWSKAQAVEVVGGHRLLEHQEIILVELAEDVEVGGGIGPVGVDHERDVADVQADGADELDVLRRAGS